MTKVGQVKNGKLVIKNDGSLENLKKALKFIFPKDLSPDGSQEFYFIVNPSTWYCGNTTNLPTVSVSEIIAEIDGLAEPTKWEPKWGELVEGRNRDKNEWVKVYFIGKNPKSNNNVVCHETGKISYFSQIRQITTPTLTIEEAEQKFNIKIKLLGN